MEGRHLLVRAVLGLLVAVPSTDFAQDSVPGPKAKLLAMYPARPSDCYVQLKPTGKEQPYVVGSREPVCRSVLANLNKLCDEPPQYNRRKLHPSTTDLREPAWQPLVPKENMDIVKATFTAVGNSAEQREAYWAGKNEQRLSALAEQGTLRLWTADVDIDRDGTLETVYMLENMYPNDPPENNGPRFVIAARGVRTQSRHAAYFTSDTADGDLWETRDKWGVKHWYSISYDPVRRWFLVQQLTHFAPMPMGAATVCTLQHIDDYRRQ